MKQFLTGIILVIAFSLFYRLLSPGSEPNFRLIGGQNFESLKMSIYSLAMRCKKTAAHGKGLNVRVIRKLLLNAFKIVAEKHSQNKECFDYERILYDNYYKLNSVLRAHKKSFLRFYKLKHYEELPRIYYLCDLIVKASEGSVSGDTFKAFVKEFNSQEPLDYAEICALKSALYYSLLEFIAIYASKIIKINKMIRRAQKDLEADKADLSLLTYNSYVYGIMTYSNEAQKNQFNGLCLSNGLDAFVRLENFYTQTARYDSRMQAAVSGVHTVEQWFNDRYTLELCPLNELLESGGVFYAQTTMETKFAYMYYISKYARKHKCAELSSARQLIDKSKAQNKDLSFFVLPQKKSAVFAYIYILSMLFLSACLSAFCYYYINGYKLLFTLITIPIWFCLVIQLFGYLSARLNKPVYMPRKDLKSIKSGIETLIVTCTLAATEQDICTAFERLETIRYANPEPYFSYGLLLDFVSANSPEQESDAALIERINACYDNLEQKSRCCVFVRKRSKNGKSYHGWEKKRGALLQLNDLIISGEQSDFCLVLGNAYKVKYCITLDSDTLINCASKLVEIMEHPYSAQTVIVPLNMRTNPYTSYTRFSKLFCSAYGLDSYSRHPASIENDAFWVGNYTGKGIYRVKEFNQKLKSRFMDNRILSHDFIEGAVAGCRNCNEYGLDDFPKDFSAFLSRQLRWLRGDWQLLPFLFFKTKNKNGKSIKNDIPPIAKWHIFVNIFASLLPLTSFAVLMLSMFLKSPLYAIITAFANVLAGLLLAIRSAALGQRRAVITEFLRQLFFASVLPAVAFHYTVAIFKTVYRLICGKNLLDWKVSAHYKGKISLMPNAVAAVVLITLTAVYGLSLVYYGFAALFLSAYALEYVLRCAKSNKKPDKEFEEYLSLVAKNTWEFFTAMQDDPLCNGLPCDNYNEKADVYAYRTSPTNIGFALISCVSAMHLGIITRAEMLKRIDAAITATEACEKWEGHLYNWIDITNLTSLTPKYISTVDSGNLLTALLLVKAQVSGVCSDNCDQYGLADRVQALIDNMNFEALYDYERGLFRIGRNETEKRFDTNHYDLMGSEAMLTYLVAIGCGKADKGAWTNLSSQCVKYSGTLLYSWTGGMFEYLMSALFLQYAQSALLHKSAVNTVKSQIRYAKSNGMPFWGVSESQYCETDGEGNYQYRAFGIPDIALSNYAAASAISPYSTFLALAFNEKCGKQNIYKMDKAGLRGRYGFYESYSGEQIIHSYMAHHQGMILCAVCNYLTGNAIINDLYSLPQIRAVQMPISLSDAYSDAKRKHKIPPPQGIDEEDLITESELTIPRLNLLSNGRYSIVTDSLGNGYSLYDGLQLIRNGLTGGFNIFAEIEGQRYGLMRGTARFCRFKSVYTNISEAFMCETEASVLSTVSGEVREVKFRNLLSKPLEVRFSTYAEVTLNTPQADTAHKAYSNLFAEVNFDTHNNYLLARRTNKPDAPLLAHFISCGKDIVYQGSRQNYFNRVATSDFGATLDPIVSGSFTVCLKAYEEISFNAYLLASYDLEYIKRTVKLLNSPDYLERIRGGAVPLNRIFGTSQKTKELAARLLYCKDFKSAHINGIDTALPTVHIDIRALGINRLKKRLDELMRLYRYGIRFNLVISYHEKYGYFNNTLDYINSALDALNFRKNALNPPVLINALEDELTYARVKEIEYPADETVKPLSAAPEPMPAKYKNAQIPLQNLEFELGLGGFMSDGAYALDISEHDTPAPWSNIMADEKFGTLITESGGGYTYFENSRECKLTAWSNDFVLDPLSEAVVLHEEGVLWSMQKGAVKTDSVYRVKHALGYTEFSNNYNGILSSLKQFIALGSDTKFYVIELSNATAKNRVVDVMLSIDPVLGDVKRSVSAEKRGTHFIIKNNISGREAYVQCSNAVNSYSFYAQSVLRGGVFIKAANLTSEGCEPRLSISAKVSIKSGQSAKLMFSLGTAFEVSFEKAEQYLEEAKKHFTALSRLEINCGDKSLHYLLKWVPYQAYCSRFLARTGFYQAGGAIGFRDQLQDCLAVKYISGQKVREHILLCAAHQFKEGDVQHWWHPPAIGVRTRIMDDRLFLPFITVDYIEYSGDFTILSERVPFLNDVALPKNQHSTYTSAEYSSTRASLLEHCLRAIELTCDFGQNGLVRMYGGDWNDGMDKIGEQGEGTTVWGSMFLYYVISRFLPYIANPETRKSYHSIRERLRAGIEDAYDGEWYRRAYTDAGNPVGSAVCEECKIDLLTQAWAVISGAADSSRARLAMQSANDMLIDAGNGIIKLLTPPFKNIKNIGYIADYPKGVRENGGQYTHAAIWYVIARLLEGKHQDAYNALSMLNPVNHCKDIEGIKKYVGEPYVIAADVYDGDYKGRAGWTWYTGSASWYYVAVVEYLLGIKINNNTLTVEPRLGADAPDFEIKIRCTFGDIRFKIDNSQKEGRWIMRVGNIVYNSNSIKLSSEMLSRNITIERDGHKEPNPLKEN